MTDIGVKYDRETSLLGLLGYPLGHSIASAVHNEVYRAAGINAVLLPMEMEDIPGNIDRFLEAVRTLRMRGFIATMPYKTRLLPYMDEVSEESRAFNCVNAVRYTNGKFCGAAFDGYGMCQAVEDTGGKLAGKEALIIGAGGIGGQVACEMAHRGIAAFTILNRTKEKAERLALILREYTGKPACAEMLTAETLGRAAERAGVVAQCTALGMYGTGTVFPYLEFIQKLPNDAVVAEALYNPPQTAFLAAASGRGLQAVNGAGMLIAQLQGLVKFFFDIKLDSAGKMAAFRAVEKAIQRMEFFN